MKKYFVNVHYDVCVCTYVNAEYEDDAHDMAVCSTMEDFKLIENGGKCKLINVNLSHSCTIKEEEIGNGEI